MILTFSGGGTRAAAFAYGVLEEMAETEIHWDGRRRLLDEVDILSAVSGGSFTAAYFGLYRERIFSEFEDRFLKRNIQGAVRARLLSPVNWFRLVSPYYDRSDLAAEYFDENLFGGMTFKDMADRGKPIVVINATNMTLGTRFGFEQNQFDWICSDLLRFPVSRAVVASSAAPVLFPPITLESYAGRCGFIPPGWLERVLGERELSTRQYQLALQMSSYLDVENQPYIHLLDGALSDNLGVRAALNFIFLGGGLPEILRRERLTDVQKIVFVIVNAQTDPDMRWAQQARSPSFASVLFSAVSIPLNQYNYETVALLRASLKEWTEEVRNERCGSSNDKGLPESAGGGESPCKELDYYIVEVGFDALSDEKERSALQGLPTSFHLPAEDVDRLRSAAKKILQDSEQFKKLLKDLNGGRTPAQP